MKKGRSLPPSFPLSFDMLSQGPLRGSLQLRHIRHHLIEILIEILTNKLSRSLVISRYLLIINKTITRVMHFLMNYQVLTIFGVVLVLLTSRSLYPEDYGASAIMPDIQLT